MANMLLIVQHPQSTWTVSCVLDTGHNMPLTAMLPVSADSLLTVLDTIARSLPTRTSHERKRHFVLCVDLTVSFTETYNDSSNLTARGCLQCCCSQGWWLCIHKACLRPAITKQPCLCARPAQLNMFDCELVYCRLSVGPASTSRTIQGRTAD